MGYLVAGGEGAGQFHDSSSKTYHESTLGEINWVAGKNDLCRVCFRSGCEVFSRNSVRLNICDSIFWKMTARAVECSVHSLIESNLPTDTLVDLESFPSS
jgi:hypothetical protein